MAETRMSKLSREDVVAHTILTKNLPYFRAVALETTATATAQPVGTSNPTPAPIVAPSIANTPQPMFTLENFNVAPYVPLLAGAAFVLVLLGLTRK